MPEVFEALLRYQEKGKVRYIGFSNLLSSDFREATGTGKAVSAQLRYGLSFQRSSSDLEIYHDRHGLGTLVYGVLGRGLLSGKYHKDSRFGEGDTRAEDPDFRDNLDRNAGIIEGVKEVAAKYRKTPSQVAIRWVLENPSVTCALVGIKTAEQVSENAGAVGWCLEKEDREYLSLLRPA